MSAALTSNTTLMKNYMQLSSAIDNCVGPGLGTITNDMFVPGQCPNVPTFQTPADKVPILSPTECVNTGQNILDVNKAQLWDPAQAGRTVTLANNLTAGYLTALAEVADVYAHGVTNPSSLCSTQAQAQTLVQNCLSQFDPTTLANVTTTIQQLCAQGPLQARQAIATIIGSVAFASVSAPASATGTATASELSTGTGTAAAGGN